MEKLFFDDYESLLRAFIATVLAYITLVIFLRISGKRTLAKMNAFDFIVTVALGSSLASVSLNKNIALAEGALVFFSFIMLQYIITWSSVRFPWVKQVVSGKPTMLFYRGQMQKDTMKKVRITEEDIMLSAREKGSANLEDIEVIVLETTGDITIISKLQGVGTHTAALVNVAGYPGNGNNRQHSKPPLQDEQATG